MFPLIEKHTIGIYYVHSQTRAVIILMLKLMLCYMLYCNFCSGVIIAIITNQGYTVLSLSLSDQLQGVHVVAEHCFEVEGDEAQSLKWEELGFWMYIPRNALLAYERCIVFVKAIIAGDFLFPEGTEPVSAVYAIFLSREFRKPVRLELQHCVFLERHGQSKFMSYAVAPHNQSSPPYRFKLVAGGAFYPNSFYGTIEQEHFCFACIVRFIRNRLTRHMSGEATSISGESQQNSKRSRA